MKVRFRDDVIRISVPVILGPVRASVVTVNREVEYDRLRERSFNLSKAYLMRTRHLGNLGQKSSTRKIL